MAQPAREAGARSSEATRAAILQHAERLFAELGFDKARLEDIAEAVGIRRASIVYYYKDKAEVYDAVLASVFGAFQRRLAAAFAQPGSVVDRIEAAVSAWVDYVGERPTFARILLREIADGPNQSSSPVRPHIVPFAEMTARFMAEHGTELKRFERIDPEHVAATIAGATIFFVAGLPVLVDGGGFDPLSAEHLAAHRSAVLRIVRKLMGYAESDTGEAA
jgi:TetR/AcrR family transcriptional regulator